MFLTIISGIISFLTAAILFFLTKRAERKAALQLHKFRNYKNLFIALSQLEVGGLTDKKCRSNYIMAVNTILLVSPPRVIDSIMELNNLIFQKSDVKSDEYRDKKKIFIDATRWSLELPFENEDYKYQLI